MLENHIVVIAHSRDNFYFIIFITRFEVDLFL